MEETQPVGGNGSGESGAMEVEELTCPVCERIIPPPRPPNCPHCSAPIDSILEILRMADMSLAEAARDISTGDLESVGKRLNAVKNLSAKHRLRADIIRAMVLRIKGQPQEALRILNSVKEKLDSGDMESGELIEQTEELCLRDQAALAACCEHYNYAIFQARRGYFEEARKSLVRALGHVPHHAPSHALLGKVDLALRRNESARYHFERAMALDPVNPSATRYIQNVGRTRKIPPLSYLYRGLRIPPGWILTIFAVLVLAMIAFIVLTSD